MGYDGYARLRRGFDRALAFDGGDRGDRGRGRDESVPPTTTTLNTPLFSTVVDAGCGTGLVGEQVRTTGVVVVVLYSTYVLCVDNV